MMLAIPAKSSLATSPVETARALERAEEPSAAIDASQRIPESPLAVVAPLAMGDPELQIELRAVTPEQREASLFDLHFAVSTPVEPKR
jgi:hypothetical protein